jgi:hypothetical protein
VSAIQQVEGQLRQIFPHAHRATRRLTGLQNNFVMKLLRAGKPAHALALMAMVGPTIKACAADNPPPGSGSHTIHSCSPNFIDENELGRLAVQQRGSGTTIAWGVYPKLPADRYKISIYIGGSVFDGKNQNYPPHGSVPPLVWSTGRKRYVRTYSPGQIFRIAGTSYDAKGGIVQKFYIKCRLV